MPTHQASHSFDVVVIGGGMAGLCAAISAARNGAKTALVHDRPVLGGNASSEVRMHICGAHGAHNKEAGLLEEIQLENYFRNPSLNFSIWDSVLYGHAFFQPNLTTFLNASCIAATMDGPPSAPRIASITAWQLTTQTTHTLSAKLFIDCSGDSILAALTPAEFRTGREARSEFNEYIEPARADAKTMGNTCLIQLRRMDHPQPFTPPKWAYKFTQPQDLPFRIDGVKGHNFWWIELGGLMDTIKDAETIRDHLQRVAYGVWDYIKNHAPAKAEAENWALEWLGSLPGKRENRRYVGDHTLTQNDIRAQEGGGGKFPDIIAYGGWSMDDHHPAGLLYPGRPTVFHPAPSPYGIPFRCLYSRNVANLLFAGRNISVTHAALSSTRVMGTCAILGQAAGTAAALCIQHRCVPRELHALHITELQHTLMDDDCFLPGLLRPIWPLAQSATLTGEGKDLPRLLDGLDRDRDHEPHAATVPIGAAVTFRWAAPVTIGGVRLVFDSHLSDPKRMPYTYPQPGNRCLVPATLVKGFRLDTLDSAGQWQTVHRATNNYQRLVRIPLQAQTAALRFVPEETWGADEARVFALEPAAIFQQEIPALPDGPPFSALVAGTDPADLAPPDSGLQKRGDTRRRAEVLKRRTAASPRPGLSAKLACGAAMNTRIAAPAEGMDQAVALLRAGRVVAFPTETVYGLGADARLEEGIRAIYAAKDRPATNPLIVHVADVAEARACVTHFPLAAEKLAGQFWPGPLTMILPRGPGVSPLVSAGLSTVALRCPRHPVAAQLLRTLGAPMAAPSANRSGFTSPTTAQHVYAELQGRVPLILDGGPCAVGLESTVLNLTTPQPTILRHGAVTREMLAKLLGPVANGAATVAPGQAAGSPGLQARHYAPHTPAYAFRRSSWPDRGGPVRNFAHASWTQHKKPVVLVSHDPSVSLPAPHDVILLPADPAGYARALYAALRAADARRPSSILVLMPDTKRGLWAAVADRLRRATQPLPLT